MTKETLQTQRNQYIFSGLPLSERLLRRCLANDNLTASDRIALSDFASDARAFPESISEMTAHYLGKRPESLDGSFNASPDGTNAHDSGVIDVPYVEGLINVLGSLSVESDKRNAVSSAIGVVKELLSHSREPRAVFRRSPNGVPAVKIPATMIRSIDAPMPYFMLADGQQIEADIGRVTDILWSEQDDSPELHARERQLIRTIGLAPIARALYSARYPHERAIHGLRMLERAFPGYTSLMPDVLRNEN